ncbi:hypothetical protein O0L34_g15724 [Tuta absoluta]|nr:hypothetical protein O0L34_g15724 [Tuta absoluta]
MSVKKIITNINAKRVKSVLQACRVCLATDGQFMSLENDPLKRIYTEFSSVPITSNDGLPQYICEICCALLKKSTKFKQKCNTAYNLLLHHLETQSLTKSNIHTIDRTDLRIPLTITGIIECNCEPDKTIPIHKEVLCKIEPISNEDVYEDGISDNDDFYENSDIKVDVTFKNEDFKSEPQSKPKEVARKRKIEKTTTKKKYKRRKNNDDLNETETNLTDAERLEDYKNRCFNRIIDTDTESFYFYILEKYFNKNKSNQNSDLISDSLDCKTTEVPTFNSIDNYDENPKTDIKNIIDYCNITNNVNRKRFYEYIQSKYINKNIATNKPKNIKDIGDIKSAKIPKNALSGEILAKFSEEYNFDVKLMLSKEKVLDVEKRKESAKYIKAKYRCKLCYTGFKTESTFQNHKTLHDPSLPYECEFCHRRFKTPQKRRHHLDKQHRYKFVCQQCGQETRDVGGAREHYRTHSGVSYECEHCQMKFDKYKSRINHIRIYHGNVPCDICHMKFSSAAGLVAHKGRAHKECFKCAVCLVQFHNANALRRHAELTAQNCGKHVRPCTQCGDSFSDETTLKRHIYDKHRPDGYKGCQPCDEDGVGLTRRRGYRKTGPQELICEICAMGGFKYEWYLRDHQLRKHFDERPFSCDHCGKKFKTKTCVMTHINRVHSDRRYACPLPLCNKAFRQSHHLTCHLRSHSNEKAFSCRTCQKQFKHPESVREHERTVHEGKPGRVRS